MFLLTDYGIADELAGVLRAVVARNAPGAPVVDITHNIGSFDVRAGALALVRALPDLGPGVVVGVVDPGVAGDRRAIAIEVPRKDGPRYLVGPDNGLLVWAADDAGGVVGAIELPAGSRQPGRSTFDGRDVFAPAAARLWDGARLADVGSPIDSDGLVRLDPLLLNVSTGKIETEVTWIDRFGNVQLSAEPHHAAEAGLGDVVEVLAGSSSKDETAPVLARRVVAFSDVRPGEVGLIVDANMHLALVGDRSSMARTLGLSAGDRVTLRAVGVSSEESGAEPPAGGPS